MLDVLEALARHVGRHADPGPVAIDLLLDNLLGLAEIGQDVEVELSGQLGHLRLGLAHLQLGIVLRDLVPDLVELPDSVLDLH